MDRDDRKDQDVEDLSDETIRLNQVRHALKLMSVPNLEISEMVKSIHISKSIEPEPFIFYEHQGIHVWYPNFKKLWPFFSTMIASSLKTDPHIYSFKNRQNFLKNSATTTSIASVAALAFLGDKHYPKTKTLALSTSILGCLISNQADFVLHAILPVFHIRRTVKHLINQGDFETLAYAYFDVSPGLYKFSLWSSGYTLKQIVSNQQNQRDKLVFTPFFNKSKSVTVDLVDSIDELE